MTTETLLDAIVVPRPNGSVALERVADFVGNTLRSQGALVGEQVFTATPHGYQLCWAVCLALMAVSVAALVRGRPGLGAALTAVTVALLLAEFELLWSPISGLVTAPERNVVGSFAGTPGGPRLIFTAHYDTTTHFGDHRSWGPWGWALGPAVGLAFATAALQWLRARRGLALPRSALLAAALVVLLPFGALVWFQSLGPLLRAPSPGALDNGGSVVALLRLGEVLRTRPADAATTVQLVFVACEEERALGSWHFAAGLERDPPTVVVNLESVGAGDLAHIPEDGFELRRFASPPALVAWADATSRAVRGVGLPPLALPLGTFTDGRSFLAHGFSTLTLRASVDGSFPHHLHSQRDDRSRLSLPAIEETTSLLYELVRRADADPATLVRLAGASDPNP